MRQIALALALIAAAVFGGALAAIHPVLPIALVLGVWLISVLLRSAFACLVGFIVVLFVRPADFFPALAVLQPAKLLALGGLFIWLAWRAFRGETRYARVPHNKFVIWLVVGVYMSSFLGSSRTDSLAQANDVFVKIVILYILIINLVDTTARARALQMWLGILSASLGGYALYAKLTGKATVEGSRAALVGLLGDPNDLALTLLMAAPFLIATALNHTGGKRVLFGLLAFLSVAGIVSTQSRGGLLGLGAATTILLRLRGMPLMKIGIGLGFGGALVLVASGITSRQSGAVGGDEIDESAQGRLDAWTAGGRMVMRHPLFGVGFGRFADNFDRYSSNPVFWGKHETHNSYIKAISETGFFGALPFYSLVVLTLRGAWRLARAKREGKDHTPLDESVLRAALPNAVGFFFSAFFLSQCWSWFIYILFAQVAATERVYLDVEPACDAR